MKIKATVTHRRKIRSSSVVTPYPKQNWLGIPPGNSQFGPVPVWNVPPPSMPLLPAFMPQNQLVAYDPYQQNELVAYDPHPQNELVAYDPHPQNELVAYDPYPQNQLVAYDPPPPVPNASPLPPQFLYHYTDYTGMCSIVGESYIRKSCPVQTNTGTGGAWYGEGVYLTAVPPSAPDNVILMNNWNDDGLNTPNSAWNAAKAARLQYCFVISSMSLTPWALEKVWDYKGRNIWVYRCDITLGDKVVALRRRW